MSTLKFFIGADIVKSGEDNQKRIIRGYASTEDGDRQGETLMQKGLDISDFLNHGYFNYDHDNSVILGYPLPTCRVDERGLYVEGELLKGIREADRLWELAIALKKSNAPRQVGFSVEGKVLERDGNRILKAKIYNIALTTNPVNTNCSWEAVVKSFRGNSEGLLDSIDKSFEAGYAVDPSEMEGGGVFRKESLDKDLHNLSYVIDSDANKKILKERLSTKKSISNNELVVYLQLVKGLSRDDAQQIVSRYNTQEVQ
ncbi:prohead protease [Exiguobacterium phage vB_EalM-132]|nr:prohead protease [Exiguobacterium phage vB_EalM-132]